MAIFMVVSAASAIPGSENEVAVIGEYPTIAKPLTMGDRCIWMWSPAATDAIAGRRPRPLQPIMGLCGLLREMPSDWMHVAQNSDCSSREQSRMLRWLSLPLSFSLLGLLYVSM